MELFSERYGFKTKKTILQVDNIDGDLRTSLWNVLCDHHWYIMCNEPYLSGNDHIQSLVRAIWRDYFKKRTDTISKYWDDVYSAMRDYFFGCSWHEVYSFIEFIVNTFDDTLYNQEFMKECNEVLERELSGYRFVGSIIAPIILKEEIAEIEEALCSIKSISLHLQTALELLSDRESPDYRNSIKESISAVEAICVLVAGNDSATLGKALSIIRRQGRVGLHPALNEAFDKLYSYTSDADGIRHALLEEPKLYFEDAKFMLVSCSAFVNYMKIKASKAGIKL